MRVYPGWLNLSMSYFPVKAFAECFRWAAFDQIGAYNMTQMYGVSLPTTLKTIQQFMQAGQGGSYRAPSTKHERYQLLQQVLISTAYVELSKPEKSIVIAYLTKMTDYSRQQIKRLITRHAQSGQIIRQQRTEKPFPKIYTDADIVLLAKLDYRHYCPSAAVARALCQRAFYIYGIDDTSRAYIAVLFEVLLSQFPFKITTFKPCFCGGVNSQKISHDLTEYLVEYVNNTRISPADGMIENRPNKIHTEDNLVDYSTYINLYNYINFHRPRAFEQLPKKMITPFDRAISLLGEKEYSDNLDGTSFVTQKMSDDEAADAIFANNFSM